VIVSNMKMINKMWTLPRGKISADAHEWSCFLAFVTFVLSLITNLFLSVLLVSVAKSTDSTRFFLLFHQNYLQ